MRTIQLRSIHEHVDEIRPSKILLISQRFNRTEKYEEGKKIPVAWLQNGEDAFKTRVESKGPISVEVQEEPGVWPWLKAGGLTPQFGMIVIAGEVCSQSVTIAARLKSDGIRIPTFLEISEEVASSPSKIRSVVKTAQSRHVTECLGRLVYLTAQRKSPRSITIDLPDIETNAKAPILSDGSFFLAAADKAEPPKRLRAEVSRIIRDTKTARRLKQLYSHECQVCGFRIHLENGLDYAEVHHVQPLGQPHKGSDTPDNMLVLCPNHHAMFDYGLPRFLSNSVILLDGQEIRLRTKHQLSVSVVEYHNAKLRHRSPMSANAR